jgi:hypothetical protein
VHHGGHVEGSGETCAGLRRATTCVAGGSSCGSTPRVSQGATIPRAVRGHRDTVHSACVRSKRAILVGQVMVLCVYLLATATAGILGIVNLLEIAIRCLSLEGI